jgi:hypothetical protein
VIFTPVRRKGTVFGLSHPVPHDLLVTAPRPE